MQALEALALGALPIFVMFLFALKGRKHPLALSAEKIINDYGVALEIHNTFPCDENVLPYSKNVIKNALIKSFEQTTDSERKDNIKTCLVLLSNFQKLTTQDKAALKRWNELLKSNAATLDERVKEAAEMASVGDLVKSLMQKSVDETEVFQNELKKRVA